jgi:hypothetical protein
MSVQRVGLSDDRGQRRHERPGHLPAAAPASPVAPEAMVEQVVAVLHRHGLIHAGGGVTYPGAVGSAIYRLAALGAYCLFLLHDDEVQRSE